MHFLHSLTFLGAHFERENLAASLLFFMVDQLATQIYLSAKSHDVTNVIFVGSFLASGSSHVRRMFREKLQNCSMYLQVSASFTHNPLFCGVIMLSYILLLQHETRPLFVRHASYMGALGALTQHLNERNHSNS